MAWGTLSTLDTLKSTFQTIAEFGEEYAFQQFQLLLDAHNKIMNGIMNDLVERTTDRQRLYGTADVMTMTKTDEHGRPDAQKSTPGALAGFPLDSYQGTLQWTRKYFQTATVAEVAGQVALMMDADIRNVIYVIKQAIFTPTNYTFNDYLMNRLDQIPLQVRAFLNADGLAIPAGPNGEIFNGSTHTHYLGTAAFSDADLTSVLETVLEHYPSGNAMIYINRAQEPAIRGFTPNFTALMNAMVMGPTTAQQIMGGERLEAVPIYNRMIGEYRGAEVWVKPWVPSSYIFVFLKDQPKPLVLRTRNPGSGDLVLVADDERAPLRAKSYEREFGVACWNRPNGGILYTGGSSYTAPTLAA